MVSLVIHLVLNNMHKIAPFEHQMVDQAVYFTVTILGSNDISACKTVLITSSKNVNEPIIKYLESWLSTPANLSLP